MGVEVITAVHAGYARFLPEAWASLQAQSHDDWGWLIQIDGLDGPVLDVLSQCGATDDSRVRVASNGTAEGPATTRNVALGRASAPLIQNLDADDQLEADGLALLVEALRRHPSAGYAVGHARDLMSTGALREHPLPVEAGILPRGCLLAAWVTEPGRCRVPVHPAATMWHRTLLSTLGGWPALHRMDDTALLMSASALCDGVLVDAPTLRYRRHPGQRSAKASKFRGGGVQVALVRERAALLSAITAWRASSDPDT